jgi:hypothetical protein
VYYDGRHGAEVQVTLRDPMRAARFTSERPLKLLPEGDAQDLLAPQLGGGAFHRCVPLAEAGAGAEALEGAVVVPYLPKDAPPEAEPVQYLVLTPAVRRSVQSVRSVRSPAAADKPRSRKEKP